jgi:hypothetical protein
MLETNRYPAKRPHFIACGKDLFRQLWRSYDTRRHHRPTIWQMVKRPSVLMHSPYVAGLQK